MAQAIINTTAVAHVSDEDLAAIEAASAIQAAYEAQAPEQAPAALPDEAEAPAEAQDDNGASFADLVFAVSDANGARARSNMMVNLQTRAAYEMSKNPNNENIQKTLSKAIKDFDNLVVAKEMIAGQVNEDFFNESEVSGKRRNVYAIPKLRDFLAGAARGHMTNAINLAIIVSMVRLSDAGIPFTGELAKGAASDKFAVPPFASVHMRRHTVSASTAPTQMSSTMTALEVLGVVKNIGTQKAPTWEFSGSAMAKAIIAAVRKNYMPITV